MNLACDLQARRTERQRRLKPLQDRFAIVDNLLTDHRQQLERLLDLYRGGDWDKCMLAERRARLEAIVVQLEGERDHQEALLAEQDLAIAQINTIEVLGARVRKDLEASDQDLELQRQVVDLLDVTARLCTEAGEKVVYATSVIAQVRLPLLPLAESCGSL